MTEFQKGILSIMNKPTATKQKKSANHIYLKHGCAELRAQLSEQKKGRHWRLENGKRVWY